MPDYGVTPEGFKAKPFDTILADIVARQRATIDPAIDTSEHEVFGNLNASIAMSLAEAWEATQDVHGMLDPDAAEAEALDAVAALTATTRETANKSRVRASVNLNNGTTLLAGTHVASVSGNPTARFTPEANFTAPSTGTHLVWFVALATGPVVANAGTLTQRDTTLSGWNSITNAEDATLGSNVESDEVMRIRREEELAAQGGGTFDGMRADVDRAAGVTACTVLENTSALTDSNGLPPHSFECLVLGGENEDVAQVIWDNKPLGIGPYGTTDVVVLDSQGVEQTVYFSRPNERRVYVALELIEVDPATYEGDDAVREAIRASAETAGQAGFLGIGVDVIANRLISAVLDPHNGVDGVIDLKLTVSFSAISNPNIEGSSRLAIQAREIATIDTGDVNIYDGGV